MKTSAELTKLAFKISELVDDLNSKEAVRLLDELQRDVAAFVKSQYAQKHVEHHE